MTQPAPPATKTPTAPPATKTPTAPPDTWTELPPPPGAGAPARARRTDLATTAPSFRLIADAVVTVDAENRVFHPGAIDVQGGRISWVGPADEAPAPSGMVTTVGGLVMPGLVNTHAHTPMTLLRGAGDGLGLHEWLRDVIWPREAAMTDDDAYWGMLAGAEELLCNGVTTTCEMYLHPHAVAEAVLASGIRAVITPGIFDVPDIGPSATWQAHLGQATQTYLDYHGRDGRIAVGFAPHALYSVPAEGLRAVARVAHQVDALVHTHVSETMADVHLVHERFGASAPEAMDQLGMLDGPVLAAHAVWMSDTDLDLFARQEVAVAHCPKSNGKLGSGVARVVEMQELGVRVGLGTDGPASNDDLDLLDEMRLAALLARSITADATALGTVDALRLATRGGADALGVPAGSLEVGRLADIIRLNLNDLRFTPALDTTELLALLVWSASSRLVTDVWVAGRAVVTAGRCATIDATAARREVARRARRLGEAARRTS
jgi:5-methylthioadenosine/S-adenosylhomocysteine deaminase